MKMIRNRVDQLSFQMTIERLKASTNFQNLMSDQQNDARNTTSGFQPDVFMEASGQAIYSAANSWNLVPELQYL